MVKTTPSFPMIHGEYQMGITRKNGKKKKKQSTLASSSKGVYFKNVFMGCYRKNLVPNFMSILTKRNERK
jgi:hypothetical protein